MSAVARRRELPAAWWGMAMLVAAEGTLIAMFVGTYFYLRFKNLRWPPAGIPEPKLALPLVLVAVLVAASAPVVRAYFAARDGRAGAALRLVALALPVQIAYVVLAVRQTAHDLGHFTPQDHAYGSVYYTLVGAAHAHVFAGILMSLWLVAKLARGLTRYRLNALLAIAFYWVAVDVLTVVVTLTVLSPAL